MNSIVLRFVEGDCNRGFTVILYREKTASHCIIDIQGNLPPAPELIIAYNTWWNIYYQLGNQRVTELLGRPVTDASLASVIEKCKKAAEELEECFNTWLESSRFSPIIKGLIRHIDHAEEFLLMVRTDDIQVQKLPWHLWSLIKDDYTKAEIVLTRQVKHLPRIKSITNLEILAVLGDDTNINLTEDRRLLRELTGREPLERPTLQELTDSLRNGSYNVLFFAGHSRTDNDSGRFSINQDQEISVEDLSYALRRAIENGLQLAIFCSCDGLGIAKSLVELGIPQVIVMREIILDRVAPEFLEYFLDELINKQQSFYLSVRHARQRLQPIEFKYPCATWLPIVYQHPDARGITIKHSILNRIFKYLQSINSLILDRNKKYLFVALIVCGIITYLNIIPPPPPPVTERISSGDKILFNDPSKEPDFSQQTNPVQVVRKRAYSDKEAGTKEYAKGSFDKAEENFNSSFTAYHNDPEALIYLNNAKISTKNSLKIVASVPITQNPNVAQEMLRGVAQAQDEVNNQGGINGKLLQVEIANDNNDLNTATQLAEYFVKNKDKDNIIAIVGPNAANAALGAAPIYKKGKLVMFSPTSFSIELSKMGKPIFTAVDVNSLANKLAEYAVENPKIKHIMICSDYSSPDNTDFSNEFKGAFLSTKKTTYVDHCLDKLKAKQIIQKIKDVNADSLLLAPNVNNIGRAIQVLQTNTNPNLILLGSTTLYTGKTTGAQEKSNGLIVPTPWHPSQDSVLVENAKTLWGGNVNWRTANSYYVTRLIIKALKNGANRETLADNLDATDIKKRPGLLLQVKPSPESSNGYDFVPFK